MKKKKKKEQKIVNGLNHKYIENQVMHFSHCSSVVFKLCYWSFGVVLETWDFKVSCDS